MADHIKLAYGLRVEDGVERLVHISEIRREETGLECNCICPACRTRLQAKLPRTDPDFTPRFAHHGADTCLHAVETAVHLKAKEILASKKWMRLPSVYEGYQKFSSTLCGEREVEFEDVKIEYRLGRIIPDVVAYVIDPESGQQKPLLVEIKVTHGIDERKLEIIRKDQLATVEVDLSNMKGIFDEEVLLEEVLASTKRKTWVYNKYSEVGRIKSEITFSERRALRLNQKMAERAKRSDWRKAKIQNVIQFLDELDEEALYRKWDREYQDDPRWKDAVMRMDIDENSVPYYINQRIPGEYIMGCDHRIWQAVLFDHYIHVKNGSRGYHSSFSLDDARVMLIREFERDIRDDFIHLKGFKELKGALDLTDVVHAYLMKLVGYGRLRNHSHKDIFKTVYEVV